MSGNCTDASMPRTVSPAPQCGAGRDLQYAQPPPFKGKFPNVTSLRRSGFKSMKSRGLSDTGIAPPLEFSWLDRAPDMTEDGSRNQGACGSCWSFATTSTLGDRYALAYGIQSPKPSVASLLSQVSSFPDTGLPSETPSTTCCMGNDIQTALTYLSTNSIQSEDCWPYSFVQSQTRSCCSNPSTQQYVAPNNLNDPSLKGCCASCCGTDTAKPTFTVKPGSVQPIRDMDGDNVDIAKTILHIKLDILQNGPIPTSIRVPSDFQDFWGKNAGSTNVYTPIAGTDGGHGVAIVGWGGDMGNQYWLMRNSWGSPGIIRFAMTKESDPISIRTGIDVPINVDANMNSIAGAPEFGGCVSFLPGPLTQDFDFPKSSEGSLTTPGQSSNKWQGGGGIFGSGGVTSKMGLPVIIGFTVVVTLIIAIFILKMNKRK